ncbi:signal recognition particle, SRP19 subunit [Schizophyllum amplum]|uniref:Signal recognition particle, SRP19 subunit n=1 Tax=Schizophyllum amplum TaxID=97359 RepID=A0A550BY65_9AGAR|nr:signal recognition particle, SRP19 subunit [Auriculariopsis ampla]
MPIIEEFDDDTDLPLPSQTLPNTGTRGPLLEEITDLNQPWPSQSASSASQASPSPFAPQRNAPSAEGLLPRNVVTDITPYKSWTCIYPIYIDAKRPYGTGQRRIARQKGVWWPLSKDIAEATNRLGLQTLLEQQKSHPRDWENPGRVRVLWKKDGRLLNPNIQTKKQLLEMISFQIQRTKPDNVPKPPYTTTKASTQPSPPAQQSPSAASKGKQPATGSKFKSTDVPPEPAKRSSGRALPVPPEPFPPLADRVSPLSPALSTGVLIDTVKAGMNAQEKEPAQPAATAANAAAMKGKRKVVRVRQ